MIDVADLRNCPFCASDEVGHDESRWNAWVECMSCGAKGPSVGSGTISDRAQAAVAWNTRRRVAAPTSPTPAQEGKP